MTDANVPIDAIVGTDWNLIAVWCRALKHRNYSRGTVGGYRRTLGQFARWCPENGTTVRTATHIHIAGWLDHLDHAPRTRYAYSSILSSFYRWAIREEHLQIDPTARVERPRLGRRLPRPAATSDVQVALAGVDRRTVALIACGVYAGMRRAEIARLHTDDLLLTRTTPLVLVHGKGDVERLVPVHDALIAALTAHGIPRHGWVFPSPTTGRSLSPGHVGKLITAGFQTAHVTPHQLRHWFGTAAYEDSQGDLRLVQELLGHQSPASTAIYTAFSRPRAAQVVRGLLSSPPEAA